MTYARPAGTFAAAITAAVAAVGSAAASAAAGVSPSRLRQLSNPCRQDSRALDVAVAIDAASAAAGSGTPIFDLYRARLVALGACSPHGRKSFTKQQLRDPGGSGMTSAAERALLDAARDVEMPGAGQLQRVRLSLAARAVKADGTLAVETQELAAAAQKYCECLGQNPATAEALGALVAASD